MKLSELRSLLREFSGTDGARPDATGIRGTGGMEEPISRDDLFPYDNAGESQYGQVGGPGAQGVGMGSSGPSHHGITPKDTEHTAWDEILEVLGSPILLVKAYGGGQTATGVPGASKGWAGDPSKPWDKDPFGMDEDMDPSIPPVEPVPNTGIPDQHGQTDDSIENLLNRIWKQDNNPSADPEQFSGGSMLPSNIYIISSPMSSRMSSMRPQASLPGLIPQESAWVPLEILAKKL